MGGLNFRGAIAPVAPVVPPPLLTDDLINAAQGLLKSQFPHINGLQEVGLGQTLSFAIQTEEFIQILHTGYCHWVTVSTIGCKDGEINIFDSFPAALTSDLMNQIAALLATPKDTIKVKYIDILKCKVAQQTVASLLLRSQLHWQTASHLER